ncbi:hypothetical protein D3M49_27645 [Klebsiella pneumoniae]|nr:hypothetical protein [Klebsiella pneumoniae]
MTGVLTGQPLSHEMYIKLPGADVVLLTEGNIIGCDTASATWTRRGLRPWHVNTISTREPGSPGTRITRLSPFAGAETSTTRLAVQGTAEPFAINFSRPFRCASLDRKKFPAHPRTSAPGRARLRPRGERLSNG